MRATLKLYASLGDFLPPEARQNRVEIELADGDSVADIIARYQLPPGLVHLVLVDGVYIAPEERPARQLRPGEVLAIWPPVAGG